MGPRKVHKLRAGKYSFMQEFLEQEWEITEEERGNFDTIDNASIDVVWDSFQKFLEVQGYPADICSKILLGKLLHDAGVEKVKRGPRKQQKFYYFPLKPVRGSQTEAIVSSDDRARYNTRSFYLNLCKTKPEHYTLRSHSLGNVSIAVLYDRSVSVEKYEAKVLKRIMNKDIKRKTCAENTNQNNSAGQIVVFDKEDKEKLNEILKELFPDGDPPGECSQIANEFPNNYSEDLSKTKGKIICSLPDESFCTKNNVQSHQEGMINYTENNLTQSSSYRSEEDILNINKTSSVIVGLNWTNPSSENFERFNERSVLSAKENILHLQEGSDKIAKKRRGRPKGSKNSSTIKKRSPECENIGEVVEINNNIPTCSNENYCATKKSRGRPRGSKNKGPKQKIDQENEDHDINLIPPKRKKSCNARKKHLTPMDSAITRGFNTSNNFFRTYPDLYSNFETLTSIATRNESIIASGEPYPAAHFSNQISNDDYNNHRNEAAGQRSSYQLETPPSVFFQSRFT